MDNMTKDLSEPSEYSMPITIDKITVRTGRLVCDVCVADPRYRYTDPKLAAFVESTHPELPHHACVNDAGYAFGDVIENTSLAHLLEHVAINMQMRQSAHTSDTFVGTTEWIDEDAGKARIEVSFFDDLVALAAFNKAVGFLNNAVIICKP